MKITVTQRIEIDGHIEEQSASAEIDEQKGYELKDLLVGKPSAQLREITKDLFKSLP
jgi:hypothetical protein